MDEAKRKEIEAKLCQLFAQIDRTQNEESPSIRISTGARVIRRRKGEPDMHIS